MTDRALLPCPFCGGDAELDTMQGYVDISTRNHGTAVAVYCRECGGQHSICRGDVPDVEPEHVIELWNRRANLTQEAATPAPDHWGYEQPGGDWVYTEYHDPNDPDCANGVPYYAAPVLPPNAPPNSSGDLTALRGSTAALAELVAAIDRMAFDPDSLNAVDRVNVYHNALAAARAAMVETAAK